MLEDTETINKIVLEVENMTLKARREYLKQFTNEEAKVIYKYIGKLKTEPIKPIEDIKPIKPIFKYEDWRESEIKECEPLNKPINKPITKPRNIYFEEGEEVSVCLCDLNTLPRSIIYLDGNNKIYINNLLNKGVNIKNAKYIINIEDDIIKIAYIDNNKVSTIAL